MPLASSFGLSSSQQDMWRKRIQNEHISAKEWKTNWGFLVEQNIHPSEPRKIHASHLNAATKSIFASAGSTKEAQVVCYSFLQEL